MVLQSATCSVDNVNIISVIHEFLQFWKQTEVMAAGLAKTLGNGKVSVFQIWLESVKKCRR